jgi:Cu-Zn family superoxide dismutase
MKKIITLATGIALASGVALAQDERSARFIDMDGEQSGTATLTSTAQGVLIDLEVSGLPAGKWVAFHVHDTGSCDHTTDHESAGGHFNPTDADHGYLAENGPHAGDMPNQYVGEDGVLRAQVFNVMVTLDEGDAGIVGRSLMIHGGTDDYESQPAGDAGDRYACAVIE